MAVVYLIVLLRFHHGLTAAGTLTCSSYYEVHFTINCGRYIYFDVLVESANEFFVKSWPRHMFHCLLYLTADKVNQTYKAAAPTNADITWPVWRLRALEAFISSSYWGWDSLRRECLGCLLASSFLISVLCVYACCGGSSSVSLFFVRWCCFKCLDVVHESSPFQDHAAAVTVCVVSWLLLPFELRMT